MLIDSLALMRNTMLSVHLIAAAVWVGGMFYALVVLRPSLSVLEPALRMQLHMLTLKRFFLVVWHAMPLMLLTGWGMVFSVWGGMAGLPWYINAMQGLALIMAAVFLFTFFGPARRLRRAIRPGPELLSRIRQMIALNLILGIITIIAGSLGHGW